MNKPDVFGDGLLLQAAWLLDDSILCDFYLTGYALYSLTIECITISYYLTQEYMHMCYFFYLILPPISAGHTKLKINWLNQSALVRSSFSMAALEFSSV